MSSPSAQTDVLIAGAGPVGLAMAVEVARYGLSVRIVDKNAQRTDKSKAIVIWSRTLEHFARMGCASQFLATGLKVPRATVVGNQKPIGHVEMSGLPTPYPFALLIPQSDTERLLEEYLATFGVKVERSTELKNFHPSAIGDSVTSTLRHSDGREETVTSSWLLGCDGAHSTVRHQLGFTFHGDTLSSDWILADVHLSGVPATPEISIAWHSEGVLALFPLSPSRYRIIANVGESSSLSEPTPCPDPTMEQVQQILDVRGLPGIRASDPVWLASFAINERKVSDYRSGRIFLAGDAAHIHSPAGGQGMNTGIQDACNLAWKLALVERGTCHDEPLLDSYSTERSEIARMVLEGTGKATSIAVMKAGVLQSIRNYVASLLFGFAPVTRTMANVLSEISIAYNNSPLNEQHNQIHSAPEPGSRAPIRENDKPIGAGDTPRFALFAEDTAAARHLLEKYSELVETAPRQPYAPNALTLVRPDGYVALSTQQSHLSNVDSYLARLTSAQQAHSA